MIDKHEMETPETDNQITAAQESHMDDDVAVAGFDLALTPSWTGYYRHPRGGVYKICKDSDGYLVTKPGGGKDSHGRGFTWREVKSNYGLAGVGWYQERRSQNGCR